MKELDEIIESLAEVRLDILQKLGAIRAIKLRLDRLESELTEELDTKGSES